MLLQPVPEQEAKQEVQQKQSLIGTWVHSPDTLVITQDTIYHNGEPYIYYIYGNLLISYAMREHKTDKEFKISGSYLYIIQGDKATAFKRVR
jgi:hypothetical protein